MGALRCRDHSYTVALPSPASWGFIVVIVVINWYEIGYIYASIWCCIGLTCIYQITYPDVPGLFALIRQSSDIGTPISSSISWIEIPCMSWALILDSAKPKYSWNTFQCCIFIMAASILLAILRSGNKVYHISHKEDNHIWENSDVLFLVEVTW